jgi:hypothetical protein
MIESIRKSLMWKWLLYSILLGTIPLAIAGYNIIQIYRENLKRSVVEIEKDKAQMVAERTENFFEKVTGLLFLYVMRILTKVTSYT